LKPEALCFQVVHLFVHVCVAYVRGWALSSSCYYGTALSAVTLLVGHQEVCLVCKKLNDEVTAWLSRAYGVVISLERVADLHMFQLMPLPLTVSCFSKIQIGFAFLVPAHLGSPGKMAIKRVCVGNGQPSEPALCQLLHRHTSIQ